MRASSSFMLATKTQSLQKGIPLLSAEPRYFDELTSQTCALAASEHPPYQAIADASCVLYLPWRGDSLAYFDGVDASCEEYVRRNTLAGRTTDTEKLQGFGVWLCVASSGRRLLQEQWAGRALREDCPAPV